MLIKDILKKEHPTISFEFFPPKEEKQWSTLYRTIENLLPLKPGYVSVTYGAGGSTRENTHTLVAKLKKETSLEVAAHLTCFGSSQDEIIKILETYEAAGIENILALKGDVPYEDERNDFPHAEDLVAFIKKRFPRMGVGVACFPEGHPASRNRLEEIDFLKRKADSGADYMVTQLFFDNHFFYDFQDRCLLAGIDIPIIAGLMAITSLKGMKRMAELSPRTCFPAPLLKSLNRASDDDGVRRAGVHWATEQVRDLLDNNVAGIHFYTLNFSKSSVEICRSLGLDSYNNL